METGTIQVEGVETFYRRKPGDGPPALFVHGVPTHSEEWVPAMEMVDGPALAFDFPGFGRSERPSPERFAGTMWDLGRFVSSFLDAMEVTDHKLVLHDWGGIGLLSAQRRPERVKRLVLCQVTPLVPGYRWHRTARMWQTPVLGEAANRLWTKPMARIALREARGDWSPPPPEFVDLVWDRLDRGTFDAILRLYRSAPPEEMARAGDDLGDVSCPALVLWATKDRYLPRRFGRAMADALPGARLEELEGLGHWPWLEDDSVFPRIARFLSEG